MADKMDLVLKQYDNALYGEYARGVIIVKKYVMIK